MTSSDDQTSPAEGAVVLPEPAPQESPSAIAADEAPPQNPPAPRSKGFVAPLLGGVLAAGLGFGLAQLVPGGWPLARTDVLEQQIAEQAAAIARLQSDLAAQAASQPAPDLSPVMDTLATLNGRMAALETGPAERAEETAAQSKLLAKLQADVAALSAALSAANPAPNVATEATAAIAAEAEARLKEAEAQAAQITAEAEALARTATARAALGRLQSAADSGAPFTDILPDLGLEAPKALLAFAETGVPSLASLQESFPDAARIALESALRADMGDSWMERATSFLRSQTGARSLTPREGSDPDAILSRAEAALGQGDLAEALGELDGLPEIAGTAMADWRSKAEERQAALRALQYIAGKIGG